MICDEPNALPNALSAVGFHCRLAAPNDVKVNPSSSPEIAHAIEMKRRKIEMSARRLNAGCFERKIKLGHRAVRMKFNLLFGCHVDPPTRLYDYTPLASGVEERMRCFSSTGSRAVERRIFCEP